MKTPQISFLGNKVYLDTNSQDDAKLIYNFLSKLETPSFYVAEFNSRVFIDSNISMVGSIACDHIYYSKNNTCFTGEDVDFIILGPFLNEYGCIKLKHNLKRAEIINDREKFIQNYYRSK